MNQDDELLTTQEVAQIVPYTVGSLRWLRHEGRGPKCFTLPGGRKVVYRRADVDAWIARGEAMAAGDAA